MAGSSGCFLMSSFKSIRAPMKSPRRIFICASMMISSGFFFWQPALIKTSAASARIKSVFFIL